MNLMKFINIPIFLISFALGIFAVYIFTDENRKILVYPTHENAEVLQYRDKTGNCFSIREESVICPAKESISEIPAQI